MLKRLLQNIFSSNIDQQPSHSYPSWLRSQDLDFVRKNHNRYPPIDEGLAIIRPSLMIEDQKEIIEEISFQLTLSPAVFEEFIIPTIEQFAKYVQLLPASKHHHHNSPGGLFRHSLEVALYSASAAREFNFTNDLSPVERFNKKPRYIVCCFLVGLMHDIGKPFSDVVITSSNSESWNPTRESLFDFAVRNDSPRIFYSWVESRHRAHNHKTLTTIALDRVVPQKMIDYIGEDIYPLVFNAVTSLDISNHIAQISQLADGLSTENDLKKRNISSLPFTNDFPIERYIIDALRRFAIREKVNTPGARIWVATSGVFVNWSSAHQEVISLLHEDCRRSIPRTPEEIAALFVEWGDVVTTNCQDHPYYCTIYPTILNGIALHVLQFASREVIFPDSIPPVTTISFSKPDSIRNEEKIDQIFETIKSSLSTENYESSNEITIIELPENKPASNSFENNSPLEAKIHTADEIPMRVDINQIAKDFMSPNTKQNSTDKKKVTNLHHEEPKKIIEELDQFYSTQPQYEPGIESEYKTFGFLVFDKCVDEYRQGRDVFYSNGSDVVIDIETIKSLSFDTDKVINHFLKEQIALSHLNSNDTTLLIINPSVIAAYSIIPKSKPTLNSPSPEKNNELSFGLIVFRMKAEFENTFEFKRDQTGTPTHVYLRKKHLRYISQESGLPETDVVDQLTEKGFIVTEGNQHFLVW